MTKYIYTDAQRAIRAKRARDKRAANPEKARKYAREYLRRKRLDPVWRDRLNAYTRTKRAKKIADKAAKQQHKCRICKREMKLQQDHNHTTGQLRDLLCGACNRGIGLFNENISALKAAARYLQKWNRIQELEILEEKNGK